MGRFVFLDSIGYGYLIEGLTTCSEIRVPLVDSPHRIVFFSHHSIIVLGATVHVGLHGAPEEYETNKIALVKR